MHVAGAVTYAGALTGYGEEFEEMSILDWILVVALYAMAVVLFRQSRKAWTASKPWKFDFFFACLEVFVGTYFLFLNISGSI